MGFDFDALRFGLELVLAIGSVLVAMAGFYYGQRRAEKKARGQIWRKFENLESEVHGLRSEVHDLSIQLEARPGVDDLEKMYDRINQMDGTLARVNGQLEGIVTNLHLVTQHLMQSEG